MLRGLPAPIRDEDTEPFWSACDRGELVAQRCGACQTFRWPPGPGCPNCGDTGSDWVPVKGHGVVYSWVVVRIPLTDALAEQIPYAVGLIELPEGIRIVSTITEISPEDIRAGMPVRVVFPESSDRPAIFSFIPV